MTGPEDRPEQVDSDSAREREETSEAVGRDEGQDTGYAGETGAERRGEG